MKQLVGVDLALDELLVQLGAMVLRLSSPEVTRTAEERHALSLSVKKFSVCASRSNDPRVHQLKTQLDATIRPQLRLVGSA